ncbi:MAG TPA: prepilin-type N-terminal cleavage/methylation domain-containing protein [Chitinispirillaceae bacterium]|nr:prepilin-type N-terminal cleavage/methylation domain-containing protein [Chitinispirillaceae bacterium]
MRKNGGFTVIEMSFALIIIGIISASVLMRLNSFSKYNSLEKEVWKVFKDFSSLRARAMKNDCTIKVSFISASKYSVLTDLNNNGTKDGTETNDTTALPSTITFGLPVTQPPSTAPPGLTLPAAGSFTSGDWETNGVIVDSTATAVVNKGSIYLSSPDFEKYTYCIAVADSIQTFKMYKWDGTTWIDQR